MDYQTTDQDSSNKLWYVVGIVVIVAFGLWYFYGAQSPAAEPSAVEQTQIPPLTAGNTTADITTDLNQTPDSAAALDQDAAASVSAVSGL